MLNTDASKEVMLEAWSEYANGVETELKQISLKFLKYSNTGD